MLTSARRSMGGVDGALAASPSHCGTEFSYPFLIICCCSTGRRRISERLVQHGRPRYCPCKPNIQMLRRSLVRELSLQTFRWRRLDLPPLRSLACSHPTPDRSLAVDTAPAGVCRRAEVHGWVAGKGWRLGQEGGRNGTEVLRAGWNPKSSPYKQPGAARLLASLLWKPEVCCG